MVLSMTNRSRVHRHESLPLTSSRSLSSGNAQHVREATAMVVLKAWQLVFTSWNGMPPLLEMVKQLEWEMDGSDG